MKKQVLANKKRLVLGLGQTGLAVARFLSKHNQVYKVMDTRQTPPGYQQLAEFADEALESWDAKKILQYDELVVSPGIAISHPDIAAAAKQGATIVGDIELFAQMNTTSVIAITGSNGKSTVTELVAELINATGKKALIGGNYGIPALQLLEQRADFIVLELSSFQLETTESLDAVAATVLNVSEDHLDRYSSYQEYIEAKLKIYQQTRKAVINADDLLSQGKVDIGTSISFGLQNADWKVDLSNGVLVHKNNQLVELASLRLQGTHNALNIAAAFALLDASGISVESEVIERAKSYQGLEHRCQLVRSDRHITYINDSKATNVGATIAALESFADQYSTIILLAGGDAKGADLQPLQENLKKLTSAVVCFGKDGPAIAKLVEDRSSLVNDLSQAVNRAYQIANQQSEKTLLLLSPACASLDQFVNYVERGKQFSKLVEALL